jgi:uncharacterized protein
MATYLRPGVYVQETLNPIPSVVGAESNSVAAFIGFTYQGPVTPTLVTSWSQYLSLYGGWSSANVMHLAVLMFFTNGGSQCYVQRVPSATAAIASRSINDRGSTAQPTLKLSAVNPGSWGNSLYITISDTPGTTGYFDLNVSFGDQLVNPIVETFTDLSMNAGDPRYAVSLINAQSNYLVATNLNSTNTANNPVATADVALSGGLDFAAGGSNPTQTQIANAVTAFNTVNNALVLNAPGITDATSVGVLLNYAQNRGDVFVVIDGINDTVANQLTLAASYTQTSYGAVYYPPLTIKDPTTSVAGATTVVGAGAAVTGLYMSTDASRGVFKAPAGLQARIAGAVSVAPIANADLDSLNSASAPVNAIRYVHGSGIVVMGARTLNTSFISKYVPIRRTLIYLEKALKELTAFAVFEPNDAKLWRQMTANTSAFLTDFWRQGGLTGSTPSQAFFVKCDADVNPQAQIDNGIVNIQIGVALQRPAEFVVIKIGQFDGGATVTIS